MDLATTMLSLLALCAIIIPGMSLCAKTLHLTFVEYENPSGTMQNGRDYCEGNGGCRIRLRYCLEPLSWYNMLPDIEEMIFGKKQCLKSRGRCFVVLLGSRHPRYMSRFEQILLCSNYNSKNDVEKCVPGWTFLNREQKSDWPLSNFLKLAPLTDPVLAQFDFAGMRGFRLKLQSYHCGHDDYAGCTNDEIWGAERLDSFIIDIHVDTALVNQSFCGKRVSAKVDGTSIKISASWTDDGQPLDEKDPCPVPRKKRDSLAEIFDLKSSATLRMVRESNNVATKRRRLCWQNKCGAHGICVEELSNGNVMEKSFCENGWHGAGCELSQGDR